MRSNPPTRRSRRSPNGDSSLPIIPILIGVIVLGFVIGAGLSLAGRHDMAAVVAVVSPSPQAASVTLAPVTPAPTERPTAEPTTAPTARPTRAPSRHASLAAAPTVKATPRPHAVRLATAAASAVATARAVPSGGTSSTGTAQAPVTAAPASPGEASASVVQTATTPASSGTQADSAFAKLSAAVVRQYLEAVKRGDQDSAYAALGASPGAKGASLTEAGVVDSQTRVGRIDARTAANDDALVSVQLQTANGRYYGNYTVHKLDTGAAVIVQHSIVKP